MVEITGTSVFHLHHLLCALADRVENGADSPPCTGCIGGMTVAMLCSGNARL